MRNIITKTQILNCGPNSNILKAYKAQFPNITQSQKELLIGILLGDGYIYTRNNKKTHGIKFEWGYKSKDYIFHIYDLLFDFILKEPKLYIRTNKKGITSKTWRMETFSGSQFNELGNLLLNSNNKKEIKKDLIINHLTPLSLAYWYMDDGGRAYYKNKRSLTDMACILNTQGFSVNEVKLLINELNIKFNLNCSLAFNKKKPIIYIPSGSYNIFYNLINPYIIELFRYKLPSN